MAVRGVDYELYRKWPALEDSIFDAGTPMGWVGASKDNGADVSASGYFNDMVAELKHMDRLDLRTVDVGLLLLVVTSATGVTPVTTGAS